MKAKLCPFCETSAAALDEKDAKIAQLQALVKTAYFEGALAGWHLSVPNDADIEEWWVESDSERALRGERGDAN